MTPAHGTLAVLGQTVENLVEISPDVVANGNHRAVNKCYPRTFSEGIQLHEQHHFDKRYRHEFYETVVGHGIGELTPQAALDKTQVILLETAVSAEMVTDEDGHYLALRQPAFTVPASFADIARRGRRSFFRISDVKFLSNSSIIQKISVTLSLVIIAYIFYNYLIFTYKGIKYLRDYQLFYLFSYPELA